MTAEVLIGWDVGGAHVKASCWQAGQLVEVRQWACPLWQGLEHLDAVLAQAAAAWGPLAQARHAVTMSGEMTDLFEHREDGVQRIAAQLQRHCGARLRLYAGAQGWVAPADAAAHWAAIASANWRASAACTAALLQGGAGLLVDIGSTTTDLIALADGQVRALALDDAGRLVSGELVYQGVVRTPLCAVAKRLPFAGRSHRVMNEWFATSADVHRLLGTLRPEHDLYPSADNGPKDAAGTCRRLARMIGLDGRDAPLDTWRAAAAAWAAAQLDEIETAAREVLAATGLPGDAPLVTAGCGAFLAEALARRLDRPARRFADLAAPGASISLADAVQVGAPAVAVAALWPVDG
jgi:probable H4MPT-linked C1 transfer pathway protein